MELQPSSPVTNISTRSVHAHRQDAPAQVDPRICLGFNSLAVIKF